MKFTTNEIHTTNLCVTATKVKNKTFSFLIVIFLGERCLQIHMSLGIVQ